MSELRSWLSRKLSEMPDDWAGTVRWLFSSLGRDRGRLVLLSALRTAAVLLGVASAAVNRGVIDAAVARSASIWLMLALFVAVQAAAQGVSLGLSWLSTVLGERLSNHLRERLYRTVLGARWDRLSGYHSEQLLSRLTSDVGSITSGLTGTAVSLLAMAVQAVAAFALLFHYDASLAVFVVIVTPVAVVTSALVSIRLRILQQRVQQAEADYRQRAQEAIAHVEVVKAMGAEDAEAGALADLQRTHERLLRRRARLSLLANGLMGAAFVAAYLFAFIHGILGIMAGTVSYGTFTAFLTLVSQVQSSLAGLGGILPRAATVVASTARVREVAELAQERRREPAPESAGRSLPPDGGTGRTGESGAEPLGVFARGLGFSYAPARPDAPCRQVFRDVDLDIAPGEIVAVMGPSGAGKTTLVRLLLGLLEPTSGEIGFTCGGASLACLDARGRVSYVPQGNTLFSGTIRDNLRMGCAAASDGELEGALAAVCALDFVERLPGGLDARVGERALGISEGQAQRIAIARALVRPAGLLLLDEATSALDEATELAVMRSLRSLPAHPTCIVITHRPEVAPLCDRVVRLRAGEHGPTRIVAGEAVGAAGPTRKRGPGAGGVLDAGGALGAAPER